MDLVELDPEAVENQLVIAERLNQLGNKIDSYYHVNQFLKSEIERLKAEKEHYAAMVNRYEQAIDKIKERALVALDTLGVASLKSDNGHSILKRPSDSVKVDDLNLLPEWAKETKIEVVPKKTEIKIALKEGEIVPGARLVTNEYVQISGPKGRKS